jgi:calcium-dependent protein kinase
MYIMLCGKPPYTGNSDPEIRSRIIEGKPPSFEAKSWNRVSADAKDLITKLLRYKFKTRISAREALNHPWITNLANRPSDETMENVLTNISAFNSSTKLKNAIHTFVATQIVTSKEIKDLKDAFLAMDKNCDGHLSKAEMTA